MFRPSVCFYHRKGLKETSGAFAVLNYEILSSRMEFDMVNVDSYIFSFVIMVALDAHMRERVHTTLVVF